MTDKNDEDVTMPDMDEVKSTLQKMFGVSAEIEVITKAELKEKEMSKIDKISDALQTVDHDSTNKLIEDFTEVLHSSEGVSVIEFGVALSVLCEIIAEGTEHTPAVAIADLVMSLTHASHVMRQRDEAEEQPTIH